MLTYSVIIKKHSIQEYDYYACASEDRSHVTRSDRKPDREQCQHKFLGMRGGDGISVLVLVKKIMHGRQLYEQKVSIETSET